MTGLVTNIHHLSATIDQFPADRWHHRGVLHGCSLTALELANYGVHEATHHLYQIEMLAPPAHNGNPAADRQGSQPRIRPADSVPSWQRKEGQADVGV